jgi:hypothetical protein
MGAWSSVKSPGHRLIGRRRLATCAVALVGVIAGYVMFVTGGSPV